MSDNLDTLILSLGSSCNLRCEYCHNAMYYDQFPRPVRMPLETVAKVVGDYAEYVKQRHPENVVVCLTGGEPLLLGIEYLSRVMEIIENVEQKSGLSIKRNMQTNATLIKEEHCDFFMKNSINISLSVDGPPALTDRHRKNIDGFVTSARIAESMDLLRKHAIPFGVLWVVTTSSLGREAEILKYLRNQQPRLVSFTPCLDRGPYILSKDYAAFLSALFAAWVDSGVPEPEVRTIKYFIQRMTGSVNMNVPCEWANDCPNTVNVSADGKMWVCDVFMGNSRGYLGDLTRSSITRVVESPKFREVKKLNQLLHEDCMDCPARECCRGGCAYRRVGGKDYLCEATLALYSRISAFLEQGFERIQTAIDEKISLPPCP